MNNFAVSNEPLMANDTRRIVIHHINEYSIVLKINKNIHSYLIILKVIERENKLKKKSFMTFYDLIYY